MARHNHPKHPRNFNSTNGFDLDYVSLPEYPRIIHVVAKPMKTIYVNLDADFDADQTHIARCYNDGILRKISERL